jgi:VCBS repeat-containing protein
MAVVFRVDEPGVGGATLWTDNTGIVDGSAAGVANDWGLSLTSGGRLGAGVGNPDKTAYSSSLLNYADGQPHVAVITRDGATTTLALDSGTPVSITDGGAAARGALDMVFGSLASNTNYFDGDIAEVRVYNTALSAAASDSLADTLMQTYSITAPTPPIAVAGDLLVNLMATDPTAATAIWDNRGTLGDFTRIGNPTVTTLAGVTAVNLNSDHPTGGWDDAFRGPTAPASITGNATRSIELWAYNPNDGLQQAEETAVAWGRRGGPEGSNLTFGYGNNVTWGAVGHWGAPDMPWYAAGGSPTLGQWHHLVYTYDGGTVRLYADGVQTYTEAVGALGTIGGLTINIGAQNGGGGTLSLTEGQPGSLSLANVRIHTGVLSAADVAANFAAGIQVASTPPVGAADNYSAIEDMTLTVAAPGVLGNDQNPSGLPMTAVLDVSPAHGNIALATNGSFTYEPSADYNGVDTFTYHAVSGGAPSAITTVTINVAARYDAALAVADSYLVTTSQLLTVNAATGVLNNDQNPDGLALTVQLVTNVGHGTLNLASDGSFTYQPQAGYTGPDAFQYRVFDTVGNSNTVTVALTIDTPPVADNESYSVNEDATLTVNAAGGLLVGDTDAENNPLSASVVSPPAHGALTLNADGSFTYVPSSNFSGPDTFTYRVSDGDQFSNNATVTINIQAVNDAPVASGDTYFGFLDMPITATAQTGVLINDSDVDGPSLSAILVDDVQFGSLVLNPNGTFTYTPAAGFTGTDGFTYKLSDTLAESSVVAVNLIVNSADAQVVINEIHYEPPENNVPAEFVELYNNGTTTVNLSGWYFSDGIDYEFPNGTTLAAGGYLLVAEDPATIASLYQKTALGPWDGSLNNEGEDVVLRNALGNKVDEVDYNLGFPWPSASAGDGPSMELINPNLDNDLGGSWRASEMTVTPRPAVTLLAASASNWKYRKGTSEASAPTTAWRQQDFTLDGTWLTGRTPIGFGDGDDNTTLADMQQILPNQQGYSSVYLRNTFSIADAAAMPARLKLRMYVDDGAIVWVNGHEVGRFHISSGEKPFNALADNHEAAWEELLIDNPASFLVVGSNTIAVQAFNTTLGSTDFSIDVELIDPGTEGLVGQPSPGAPNSVFAANAAPQMRQVHHTVDTPAAGQTNVITVKVTDPNGVASVQLHYQVVTPGNYIPATLPTAVGTLQAGIVPDSQDANPAFENPANWTNVAMVDDGTGGDAVAGDNIYSATVPGQINRALVRYRITATDTFGASVRAPYADDPSLNFAYYVYNGIPAYQGTSAEVLESLPVYTIITRPADMYDAAALDGSREIPQFIGAASNPARFYENWEAAFVYDGVVYDHIHYRLGGANGRYQAEGKRNWRFRFNRGNFLAARDEDGNLYPEKWRMLTVGKGLSNRLTLTYGLNEVVNYALWNAVDVPAPETHYFHMRVVDGPDEAPDPWQGDFWGLHWAQETYDVRFLEAHDLEKGNLYKLINSTDNPLDQERYLAPDAVHNGADHNNIEANLRSTQTTDWLNAHVDYDEWFRFHAIAQAIRHYDYWPSANKNAAWYFEPTYAPENDFYGQLWVLPWDTDSTWGPTYNCGEDRPYDAILPSCGIGGGDAGGNAELARMYRNEVREVRDLLWQPDQINPFIDSYAADIAAFIPADRARWNTVPAALQSTILPNVVGSYAGLGNNFDLAGYVADMKKFAFTGGSWPGDDGSIPGGTDPTGRDDWLDQLQASGGDGVLIPNTPTISYAGDAGFPIDGIRFQTGAFADPQGNNTFGSMEWRIGEITDPTAPAYDPNERFKLEIEDLWNSGELATYNNTVSVPLGELDTGHTYRARVRMKDTSGVWSHWSAPVTFTTTGPVNSEQVAAHLRVSEIMYNPPAASEAEAALGFSDQDFEYVEFTNTGAQTLNLVNVRIVDGVTFHFADAAINTLAPGDHLLVVKSIAAMEARYGTGLPIAGEFEEGTALSNSGESLKIEDVGNAVIQDFTFDDNGPGWHPSTDGEQFSLVIRDASANALTWSDPASWRTSYEVNGSPGEADLVNGDLDGNERVDLVDLAILQGHLGTASGGLRSEGDLTGDGAINRADVATLAHNFGRQYAAPVESPVAPEPAASIVARTSARDAATAVVANGALAARPARRSALATTIPLEAASVDQILGDATAETASTVLRARRSRSI